MVHVTGALERKMLFGPIQAYWHQSQYVCSLVLCSCFFVIQIHISVGKAWDIVRGHYHKKAKEQRIEHSYRVRHVTANSSCCCVTNSHLAYSSKTKMLLHVVQWTGYDNFLQVKELSLLIFSTNLTHKGFTLVWGSAKLGDTVVQL